MPINSFAILENVTFASDGQVIKGPLFRRATAGTFPAAPPHPLYAWIVFEGVFPPFGLILQMCDQAGTIWWESSGPLSPSVAFPGQPPLQEVFWRMDDVGIPAPGNYTIRLLGCDAPGLPIRVLATHPLDALVL